MCISCSQDRTDTCCNYFEMIPPFLAFAACVTGVVTSLIARSRYLVIPHAVGAISSVHLFSLPMRLADARSIRANVNDLKEENSKLKEEVEKFEANNRDLESSIDSFKLEKEKLKTAIEFLKETLFLAKDEVVFEINSENEKSQKDLVGNVTKIINRLKEDVQQEVMQENQIQARLLRQEIYNLSKHVDKLKVLEENLSKSSNSLAEGVGNLRTEVDRLKKVEDAEEPGG